MQSHGIDHLYYHERFDPYGIQLQSNLKAQLGQSKVHTYNGTLLWHPEEIHKSDGTPYKVFHSFYRGAACNSALPRPPLLKSHQMNSLLQMNQQA